MNASELIVRVRDALNEPSTSSTWTEAEILRYINDAYVMLAGRAMRKNVAFFQRSITLAASDATLLSKDEYEYKLPFPVERIIDLRGDRTTEQRGEGIGHTHLKTVHTSGWSFSGYNTLIVRGHYAGQDLSARVQARPARLTIGSVPLNSDACNTMYMAASSAIYPVEHLTNIYAGSLFQLTGTGSGDHRPSGQYNLVTLSEPHVKGTDNNYYTNLTFQSNWLTEPQAGDTYSMIPAMPETTHLLLALKAAQAAYHKTNNVAGMQTILPSVQEEERHFTDMLAERNSQGPEFIPTSDDHEYSEDLDRDTSLAPWS